ncbi:DNA integrity scanning protein, partial [Aphelenchoides avenae]
ISSNGRNTAASLPSGSESIEETEGWFEMESIQLSDGFLKLEQASSDKAAAAEVKEEIGASSSEAAPVDKRVQRQRCPICGAWSSRGNLRRHMLVHTKREPLICAVCGKGILCLSSLKTHMMLVHSDDSPFGCTLCTSRFKFQSGLTTHMKTVHGQTPENVPYKSSKQHQCTICLRAYTSKERLRSHMLVHIKQERLLCTTCGKGFRNEVALNKHLVVHSSEKQFKCELCTTTFKHRVTMMRHMCRLHGMGGVHRCEQCSSVFACAKRLTRHQETRCESIVAANNQNNHVCPQCGKDFATKEKLKAHLVIHSDERPFACSECDFTAKRRYQLRQHQRWHTGELFRCEHCDYAHPLKAEFDRHSKVHETQPTKPAYTGGKRDAGLRYEPDRYNANIATTRRTILRLCGNTGRDISVIKLMTKDAQMGQRRHQGTQLSPVNTEMQALGTNQNSYNGPCTSASSSARTEIIGETEGWFEMECIELDDGCIGPEQSSSDKAASAEVRMEIGASGSKAAAKQHQCKICLRTGSTRELLKSHVLVHTNHKRVLCTTCGRSCRDKDALGKHLLAHSSEKPFACSECDFAAKRRYSLKVYQRKHTGELFKCPHCDYARATKFEVDRHSKMAQPSSYVESLLHKLFAVSNEEETNSADAGVVEEPEYPSVFETPYRFKCTWCGYRGHTRTDAELHFKRHTGEKPFWCVECDEKFAKMDQIKEHKRRNPRGECRLKPPNQLGGTQVPGASNEEPNEALVFEPGYPSGKKYKCRRCEYRSNLRKNVVRHAQCHSTAKPFACVPCKKDFARRDKLKEHRDKYHSGRGPIKCNRCDFAAMRGATWRNHQMTAHSIPFEKIMMECLSETTGEHLNGECGVDSIASDTLDPAEAQGWLSETPSTSDPSTPAAFAIDEAEGWFEMETIEIEECTGPGEVHSCDTTAEEDDVVDAEPNSKHTDTRRKCGHSDVRGVQRPTGTNTISTLT